MRYYRIKFFDGPSVEKSELVVDGFMEVTDERTFARLTDVEGNTLEGKSCPAASYTTIDSDECEKPVWGK